MNTMTKRSVRETAAKLGIRPTAVQHRRQRSPEYQADDDGMVTVERVRGRDGKLRPDRAVDTTQRDKQIFRLYYRDHKSMRAVAAELGCSVGTVHRVLNS